MQIREQGKQLQCIRTEYVPEKKRTFGRVVAKQDRYLSTVSDEVRQQLTKEEVDDLEAYLSRRSEKQSVESMKLHLSTVAYSARRGVEALSVDEIVSDLSVADAENIYSAIDDLAKALRKRGFKRKPAIKSAPGVVKKQDETLDFGGE